MTGPSLQARLRARRLELGLKQSELARILRVSKPLMCRWEREVDTPSVGRFLQWIDALGLEWNLTPRAHTVTQSVIVEGGLRDQCTLKP